MDNLLGVQENSWGMVWGDPVGDVGGGGTER